MNAAYKIVKSNKGSGGIDGMSTEALLAYLKKHGSEFIASLLEGTYKPNPVRRVEIPKANGKKRGLGIPTVVDRTVQQAISQVLEVLYEPQFSEMSYGFRPHRGSHRALLKCGEYIEQGYLFTVDMDLEKFFDTVNHSKLRGVVSYYQGQSLSISDTSLSERRCHQLRQIPAYSTRAISGWPFESNIKQHYAQ